MRKWILQVVTVLCLLFIACLGLIHYVFEIKKYKTAHPVNEHWIHKGLYDNRSVFENTIPAFDSAFKKGIAGIEFDIFYVDSLNDFVVTHDMPNKFSLPALRLRDVLGRYDTAFSYWLDLKNLTDANKELISIKLDNILQGRLKPGVYIESAHAAPLGYLAENGFKTIYWIQYDTANLLKKLVKTTMIKWNFIRYKFAGATIAASMTSTGFFDTFHHVPKFIFHIYTPELYSRIKKQANIAVYLMDYIPAGQNE